MSFPTLDFLVNKYEFQKYFCLLLHFIHRIALAFGVTVATIAQSIGHVSGCHINPAVTFGLLFGQKIGLVKSILYILSQCIGAAIGAALLMAFTPGPWNLGNTGFTDINSGQVCIKIQLLGINVYITHYMHFLNNVYL